MSNLINIEITLAFFLVLLQWHQLNVPKVICCKDNSRLVRKIVQTKWMPTFEKYKVQVPKECPLNLLRDIYEPREKFKEKHRLSQWTCKKCGKHFYDEKYIDEHLQNRHQYIINNAEDAICLADYCDIMRCDVLSSESKISPFGVSEKVTDLEIWADVSSQSHTTTTTTTTLIPAQSIPFITITPDHKKKSMLIPKKTDTTPSNKYDTHSNHIYGRKLCQQQHQHDRENNKPSSSTTTRRVVRMNTKDENKKSDSNSNTDNKLPFVVNQQKFKNHCKSEELLKIKYKCESIVRTCMYGLLLEMSDHTFKEMEDELNKSVCWYLTCERYWDGEIIKNRVFPWGLILAVVIILSLGICFCYYIIWILFESGDNSIYMINNSSGGYDNTTNYGQRQIDIINRTNNGQLQQQPLIYDIDNQRHHHHHHLENSSFQVDSASSIDLTTSNNEHYIYVTYPPELKSRFLDKYE